MHISQVKFSSRVTGTILSSEKTTCRSIDCFQSDAAHATILSVDLTGWKPCLAVFCDLLQVANVQLGRIVSPANDDTVLCAVSVYPT